ncbi:hypothetical protein D3C71_2245500 [compost metagenome]
MVLEPPLEPLASMVPFTTILPFTMMIRRPPVPFCAFAQAGPVVPLTDVVP